jgi:hypothetical protein
MLIKFLNCWLQRNSCKIIPIAYNQSCSLSKISFLNFKKQIILHLKLQKKICSNIFNRKYLKSLKRISLKGSYQITLSVRMEKIWHLTFLKIYLLIFQENWFLIWNNISRKFRCYLEFQKKSDSTQMSRK